MREWHTLDEKEVLKELKTSENGLSEREAGERLKKYGRNELKETEKLSAFFIFLLQFKSVFVYLLLFAAIFSLFIEHYIDFGVIMIIVGINAFIGFFQQYKAEKIIAEMKKLLVSKVKIMRDGKISEIDARELVIGDIIILSEGDKIMADCRIIHSDDLQANEAVLTGESFPVSKNALKINSERILAERKNMAYMGCSIVRGNARAVVVAAGMNSEFGKIAGMAQKIEIKKTVLEEKLDSFSKKLVLVVAGLAIITILIGLYRGEDVYYMTLTAIALAISIVPEGLPAVIALTLAFAIQRMKKRNSLIRKLPAAETLGRVTVICADKTGTMTAEEMAVREIYYDSKKIIIKNSSFFNDGKKIDASKDKNLANLLKIGILCNNARFDDGKIIGDPTEEALINSAIRAGIDKKKETEKEVRIKEFAFSSHRKMMSIVREGAHGQLISYVKGAPDIILANCSHEFANGKNILLTLKRKKELLSIYNEMAGKALRVLGFAFKRVRAEFNQKSAESGLVFMGFQGMIDMPRKEIAGAVKECISAGIKVKMLTGDSLLTAIAVSEMIGLETNGVSGAELEKMPEKEFDLCIKEKTIFARITPEIKLKIVEKLKEQGEIVAVTGDGVNDVLALKEAHIGIATGIRGTDVTRDVADIILLDDNFNSIVRAVHEGRRVFDNIKKSIKFHLVANFVELFAIMVALILAMPLPFLPLAILWLNLITDSFPSLALTVEHAEKDIMKRKPINRDEGILSNTIWFIVIGGIISFIVTFGLFSLFYQADLAKARTIALSASAFFELFIVFACRSDKSNFEIGWFSNKYLLYSVLLSFALQIIAIYSPLRRIFGFVPISFGELAMTIGLASLGLVIFESWRIYKKKYKNYREF